MSNSPLFNSLNRSANVKRKMPDSFYRPPVLKTQLFSAYENHQRSINHSHTNSLPVDTVPPQITNLNSAQSVSNIYEKSIAMGHHQPIPSTPYQVVNNDKPKSLYQSPVITNKSSEHQQYYHAKTFSLPVSFEQNTALPNSYISSSQTFAPPVRSYNPNGDIPLPPGWECQKAYNGQFFYINHFTKTTTWDDPRKLYNLPINQNEISNDLRSTIINTIQLPTGWEEARTATGEIYFINHNNKTTCWEDPRINIYMQQQHQKHFYDQNYNMKMNYNNSYMAQNQGMQTQYSSNSSSSSLCSSSLSLNSSSNSISALSNSNQKLNNQSNHLTLPVSKVLSSTNNQQLMYQPTKNPNPNEQHILNLRKSLDEVVEQKASICRQIDELSKLEQNLKSKLSPQDLDDVLKILKNSDIKMGSFSHIDQPINNNQISQKSLIHSNNLNSNANNSICNNLNNSLLDNSNITDASQDSTFIADTSANNLNTSTS